jgi:hypothetical protein
MEIKIKMPELSDVMSFTIKGATFINTAFKNYKPPEAATATNTKADSL